MSPPTTERPYESQPPRRREPELVRESIATSFRGLLDLPWLPYHTYNLLRGATMLCAHYPYVGAFGDAVRLVYMYICGLSLGPVQAANTDMQLVW